MNPAITRFKTFRLSAFLLLKSSLWLAVSQTSAETPVSVVPYSADLDFGIIANEDGICRMNDRGNLIGLAGQSCLGSGTRGIFEIQGEPGRVVYIEATGASQQGITFNPDVAGSATKVISSAGKTLVVLSGDLVLQNASSGQHSINYLMCVHYE